MISLGSDSNITSCSLTALCYLADITQRKQFGLKFPELFNGYVGCVKGSRSEWEIEDPILNFTWAR